MSMITITIVFKYLQKSCRATGINFCRMISFGHFIYLLILLQSYFFAYYTVYNSGKVFDLAIWQIQHKPSN